MGVDPHKRMVEEIASDLERQMSTGHRVYVVNRDSLATAYAAILTGEQTFVVPRSKMREAFLRGLRGGRDPMPVIATDPDAFALHGGGHAIDRWADDGGRAP